MTDIVRGICSIVLAITKKIIPKNKPPTTTADLNNILKERRLGSSKTNLFSEISIIVGTMAIRYAARGSDTISQSFTLPILYEKSRKRNTEPPQTSMKPKRNGIHPIKYNAPAQPAVDALISVK